jgi:predicted dehydrogenase
MPGDKIGLDLLLVSPYHDINHGRMILESLRVGVIGAGKMGLLHAAIFNALNRSKLTAVSETDSMIRGALRQNLPGIGIFKDYRRMIESESLDAIVVTTPVFLHKPIVEMSLERGLNVFVEKPMAMNGTECQDLLRRMKSSRTMVGYCRRYMGTYLRGVPVVPPVDPS